MLFRVSLSGATLFIMQGVRCTGRYDVRGATAAAFALSVYLRPCEKKSKFHTHAALSVVPSLSYPLYSATP